MNTTASCACLTVVSLRSKVGLVEIGRQGLTGGVAEVPCCHPVMPGRCVDETARTHRMERRTVRVLNPLPARGLSPSHRIHIVEQAHRVGLDTETVEPARGALPQRGDDIRYFR